MPEVKKVLTAADIEAAEDLRRVPLDVPEWGGTVFVREMSCAEMDLFSPVAARLSKAEFTMRDMCTVAALTLCDADGVLLFDGPDKLPKKNAKPIQAVFLKALEVSGLTKTGIEDEKKD